MRALILLFSFISGVCGIAYEVLYTRLLSTYFGNIFYISAAILIAFLVSIGIGSKIGWKFKKYISTIEIAIGVYAIGAVYFFNIFAVSIFSNIDTTTRLFPFLLVGLVSIFLILPAMLIGFALPIFNLYLQDYKTSSFRYIYSLYNLGAAISVLCIEFLLIRSFGIPASIITMACINIVNGILLFFVLKTDNKPSIKKESDDDRESNFIIPLFLISIASGVFQLFFLKFLYSVFGPFNENFSILLFTMLLGIALCGIAFRKISFENYITYGVCIVLIMGLAITPFIYLWALIQEQTGLVSDNVLILKVAVISLFSLPVFTFFGNSIPVLLDKQKKGNFGGFLAVASFGNVTGYILMTFVLYEKVIDSMIPFVVVLLLMVSLFTIKEVSKKSYLYFTLIIIITFFIFIFWPQKLLNTGYQNLKSLDSIKNIQENMLSWESYKKYNSTVSVSHFKDGTKLLSVGGYISLRFRQDGLTWLRETVVGISPAVYSKKHDKALVLGLGSGVTANAVANSYKKTKVIEISPAMLKGSNSFKEENMNILNNQNISVILQDGIIEILNSKEKYDAIINTVTSPELVSSGKLWTKEVFDAISLKLNDGGIYSMWLDITIGVEGIQILTKTAHSSFRDCKYVYLNQGYLNVICGNSQIKETVEKNYFTTELQNRLHDTREHIEPDEINLFIKNLTLKIPEYRLFTTTTKINTLDHPVLEFLSHSAKNNNSEIGLFMEKIFIESMQMDAFSGLHLENNDFKRRCSDLKKISPPSIKFCNRK